MDIKLSECLHPQRPRAIFRQLVRDMEGLQLRVDQIWSAMHGIGSLCDDVLRLIFLHFLVDWWMDDEPVESAKAMAAILYTCRRWRAVIENSPALWSFITLRFVADGDIEALPFVLMQLELSKNAPLSLELFSAPEYSLEHETTDVNFLRPHLWRIRSLTSNAIGLGALLPLLPLEMPSVRRVTFNISDGRMDRLLTASLARVKGLLLEPNPDLEEITFVDDDYGALYEDEDEYYEDEHDGETYARLPRIPFFAHHNSNTSLPNLWRVAFYGSDHGTQTYHTLLEVQGLKSMLLANVEVRAIGQYNFSGIQWFSASIGPKSSEYQAVHAMQSMCNLKGASFAFGEYHDGLLLFAQKVKLPKSLLYLSLTTNVKSGLASRTFESRLRQGLESLGVRSLKRFRLGGCNNLLETAVRILAADGIRFDVFQMHIRSVYESTKLFKACDEYAAAQDIRAEYVRLGRRVTDATLINRNSAPTLPGATSLCLFHSEYEYETEGGTYGWI